MPRLPIEILRSRLKNEIATCIRKLEHKFDVANPDLTSFPIEINVKMIRCPGPIMKNEKITHQFNHKFKMEITEDYPYQKPIITWQSPIFHPNIMLPEDGGHVCSKLLDDWGFNSNLLAFIRGIESLLANPNPGNPFGTDSCTYAAYIFHQSPYKPPMIVKRADTGPKIVPRG
jgi:ubiquitin-protein ligase